MTTRIDLGFPKLLPITGTWTLPFAAYLSLLTNRIVATRLREEKYLGDSLRSATPRDAQRDPSDAQHPDELYLQSRAQANFLENVPLALLLAAVAELNGGNRKVLHYGLATLFALRVAHVELGLKREGTLGVGRPVAYYGTQGLIWGVAAYGGWLVKGYWGL